MVLLSALAVMALVPDCATGDRERERPGRLVGAAAAVAAAEAAAAAAEDLGVSDLGVPGSGWPRRGRAVR